MRDSVQRIFHHIAESKSLPFQINIHSTLPRTFTSDHKRLQQILKNLLSNAFKFTAQAQVSMSIRPVVGGWSADHPVLRYAQNVVAFEVVEGEVVGNWYGRRPGAVRPKLKWETDVTESSDTIVSTSKDGDS